MGRRVDFKGTFDFEQLQVSEDVKALEAEHVDFPLWDVLKELQRRERRRVRDRTRDGRDEESKAVRAYMSANPQIVEEIKRKYGLT